MTLHSGEGRLLLLSYPEPASHSLQVPWTYEVREGRGVFMLAPAHPQKNIFYRTKSFQQTAAAVTSAVWKATA